MSVIQDALRRKMQEEGERRGQKAEEAPPPEPQTYVPPVMGPSPRRHARPHAEPPAPASYAPPAPARPASSPVLTWILVLLTAALLAALWIMLQGRFKPTAATSSLPSPPVDLPTPPARAAVAPEAPVMEASAEEGDAAAAGVVEEEASVASAGPTAAKQTTVTRDDWPRIELMGILAGGEGRRSTAILNGSLVMLSAEIDGVKLAEVGEDGVYLEFKGDRQYIRIGERTR